MGNGGKVFSCCIVVAAGKASRMAGNANKQYIMVGGKPILARTLAIFETCASVDEIIVVIGKDDRDKYETKIGRYGFHKVRAVVEGGDTRQQSVYSGLRAVDDSTGIVLIHDGARPFVEQGVVERCINTAREFGGCCAAVPLKDTIKYVDDECFARKTPDRKRLWAIQTPQVFDYGIILEAHRKALKDGFTGTDDAVLAERLGIKIKMVMGSYHNIKITTSEDLLFAEAIAGLKHS